MCIYCIRYCNNFHVKIPTFNKFLNFIAQMLLINGLVFLFDNKKQLKSDQGELKWTSIKQKPKIVEFIYK